MISTPQRICTRNTASEHPGGEEAGPSPRAAGGDGLSSGARANLWGMGVGLSLLGLQARAQLPALDPQDVQPLLGFVLPRHALARAAPAHIPKRTLICARTRLPPRSASYLPRRRSWSRTPGMQGTVQALEQRLDQPVPQSGTLPGDAAPAARRRGVGTWTPGFGLSRPASQSPPIGGQRRGLLGRGGEGGLLRMRSGEAVLP